MFLDPIKAEVRGMLLYANEHVREAEQKLAATTPAPACAPLVNWCF